jgi:hypothetical protein
MATALSEWLGRGTLRGPDGAKGWSALVVSTTAQRAGPGRIAGRNDTSWIEKTKLLRVRDSQRRREVDKSLAEYKGTQIVRRTAGPSHESQPVVLRALQLRSSVSGFLTSKSKQNRPAGCAHSFA